MKPEILVLVPIYAPTLAALEREYTVHKLWTARDPDALVKEVSGRVRGVVTTGSSGMSSGLIERCPGWKSLAASARLEEPWTSRWRKGAA